MPNDIRPLAKTRFKTGSAALAVFDPACLRHRADDDADWWSIEREEIAEVNAGNAFFIDLGADGTYDCEIYRDQEPQQGVPPACRAKIAQGASTLAQVKKSRAMV